MQDINKIELSGLVGAVRRINFQGKDVVNFSLKTDYCYINEEGFIICETTWHNVVVWEADNIPPLDSIQKGSRIHLIGRMRSNKYMSSDGIEQRFQEVVAHSLMIIEAA